MGNCRAFFFSLLAVLASCSTAPTVPYWDDSDWNSALDTAIRKNVVYPDPIVSGYVAVQGYNFYGYPTIMDELPSGHGTVSFDYHDGWLINAKMVASTGSSMLDDVIIKGVEKTKPPRVGGDYRSIFHHFEFTFDLKPSPDQLRTVIYSRIVDKMTLPKSEFPPQPVMIFIRANYLNGAFISLDLDQPDGYDTVVADILRMVKGASLPAAPAAFKDQTVRVDMRFCLSLGLKPCDFDKSSKWADFSGLTYNIPHDEP